MFEKMSDDELAANIKERNCSDSLTELMKRHHGLVVTIAKKYASVDSCSGIGLDDFLDERPYLVYKAATEFDASRGTKFGTWLGNSVRWHCQTTRGKELRYYNSDPTSIEFLINSKSAEDSGDTRTIEEEADYIMSIVSQLKDKRIEKIVRMRYYSPLKEQRSFHTIAKKLKMSTQGVIDLHESFIRFIKLKMKSDNNMDTV